jgi:hypothetical protein
MNTEHTIAPWIINVSSQDGVGFEIVDSRISDDKRSTICAIYETFNRESIGNANLISASPLLLESLIGALKFINYNHRGDNLPRGLEKWQSAIDKALGNK